MLAEQADSQLAHGAPDWLLFRTAARHDFATMILAVTAQPP